MLSDHGGWSLAICDLGSRANLAEQQQTLELFQALTSQRAICAAFEESALAEGIQYGHLCIYKVKRR